MRALKIILCVVTALSILTFGLAIYYTQFFKDTVSPEFSLAMSSELRFAASPSIVTVALLSAKG